jgi:inhibitor of KinA sporulation pathway (predicted exonuclease)
MGRDARYDKGILVIDLEATCWEGSKPPAGMESEIIEVGYALLTLSTYEINQFGGIYVKPEKSTVSDFCFNLTGITQQILDEYGVSLYSAFDILVHDLKSRKMPWASYGFYDKRMIDESCRKLKLPKPLDNSHINVKALFPLVFNLTKEVGLDKALSIASLEMIGKHHSGKDDAHNIARLLGIILKKLKK